VSAGSVGVLDSQLTVISVSRCPVVVNRAGDEGQLLDAECCWLEEKLNYM
jgi:hypothetical protein